MSYSLTSPTQSPGDNTVKNATTAFVTAAIAAAVPQTITTAGTPQFARLGIGGAADATHLLKITGGTVTADTQVLNAIQTWNNSGVTFTGMKFTVTNTASNSASKIFEYFVGAGSVIALRVDGLLTLAGGVQAGGSIISASTSRFGFGLTRAQMDSPADSRIRLMNAALDNFSRLTLGLETTAFPALKRNGTAVNFRLGDDSADCPITASDITASGNIIASGTASVIRLKGYTVATLPAGTQGNTAFVTDALAPTFLATIVGGGTVVTPVFYNGTNWVGY